ncbi:MAG: hypothetical protein ABI822_27095 [Bryobacteraceae bacterium]
MSVQALDICLALALAGMLLVSFAPLFPIGPEGGVGLWLVAVPPLTFAFFAILGMLLRGSFDWIPGGKGSGSLLFVGLMIGLGTAMLAALENSGPLTNRLLALSPYAVIACCAVVLHGWPPRSGMISAVAVLGCGGLFGWALLFQNVMDRANREMQQVDLRTAESIAASEQISSRDLAEYHELPADVPLSRLLPFQFSPNAAVRRECLDRIAHWPHLEEELSALLNGTSGTEGADWAARYIAGGLASPSATLAPAFGQYLDRGIDRWRTDLLYGKDYAAKWEPELMPYVEGARRIQQAGGDLRSHLKPWYDVLVQIAGLRGMAREIKSQLSYGR